MELGIFIELIAWTIFGFKRKENQPIKIPITHVVHDHDDSWHFYSGSLQTKVRIVHFHEAVESDATVKEVKKLPIGYAATRDMKDTKWILSKQITA